MSHTHEPPPSPPPTPVDSGSHALAEALRSSFAIVRFVLVGLVLLFLISGFFSVGLQEKAIILRFGKPVGEGGRELLGPGLHFALPYPIDEVVKVPITEIQTVQSTVGWYATTPEQELAGTEPPPGLSLNPAVDGYLLTADKNIIHSRATLRYRIDDPIRHVFGFVNASNAVQNSLNNALLHAAARFSVDQILTSDRTAFQEAVTRRFAQLAQAQQLGVVVDQCSVDSRAPRQLKQAFDNVITQGQNRSKSLNEARGYENQVTNRAASASTATRNAALAARTRYLEDLAADGDRFREVLPNYTNNPDLYVQLRMTEALTRVLTNVSDKVYLAERADGQPRELRLLLNREPQKPRTEQPQP